VSSAARGLSDVLRARLASQRLAGSRCSDVVAATRHLLAVQAQDPRGARLALRVRTHGTGAADLDRALTDERSLIVTWVNRGTLHLVTPEDEAFLHLLTTPQLRTGNERRLRQEGVSPGDADRGVALVERALATDGPLSRAALRERLDRAGIPTAGQALVHLLFRATLDGLVVRGPMAGVEQAFVLRNDWLGPRPPVERSVALAELARRYLRGHAPADAADLARWAGLPVREARAGLGAIASQLRERPDGLMALRDAPEPAAVPRALLLGPFDPLLLGWREREFVLGDARSVVTVNGIFRPVVLVDGRAVGTWTMPRGRVELALWEELDREATVALADEARAVTEFLAR
jgi:hypothetical protein